MLFRSKVEEDNSLSECTKRVCAVYKKPYCDTLKTDLDTVFKEKMFEKFEGTSTTQSGRIVDWTITSGIGPEKGLDFQTTVGSYKDEDSEFYGAKAKFLKYFSFAAVYGNREGSETQDECE